MTKRYGGEFSATLFQYPGKGAWTFAPVPEKYAPSVTHGWGRTPVRASVDGHAWDTSVWRGKTGKTLLAIPKHVRGAKGDGDAVRVRIEFTALQDVRAVDSCALRSGSQRGANVCDG